MSANDPNLYPGQIPKKKISPWFWVTVGLGAVLAILLMVIVAGGLFVWYKVRQAGLDPEMMQRNPALAVAKIVAATNPNVEVLGVDEKKGVIRVREKSSGKIMTMNFEDAKQGKFVGGVGTGLLVGAGGHAQMAADETGGGGEHRIGRAAQVAVHQHHERHADGAGQKREQAAGPVAEKTLGKKS